MCGYRVIPLFYPSVQLTFFNHMHEALLLQLKKKRGKAPFRKSPGSLRGHLVSAQAPSSEDFSTELAIKLLDVS